MQDTQGLFLEGNSPTVEDEYKKQIVVREIKHTLYCRC
jgi:hypothetical protein